MSLRYLQHLNIKNRLSFRRILLNHILLLTQLEHVACARRDHLQKVIISQCACSHTYHYIYRYGDLYGVDNHLFWPLPELSLLRTDALTRIEIQGHTQTLRWVRSTSPLNVTSSQSHDPRPPVKRVQLCSGGRQPQQICITKTSISSLHRKLANEEH